MKVFTLDFIKAFFLCTGHFVSKFICSALSNIAVKKYKNFDIKISYMFSY